MTFTKHFLVFVVLIFLTCYALDSPCADWQLFKDEKCFKILDDTFRTFAEAETNCAKLDDSSTLVTIHSKEEQDFLVNYLFKTQKKVDNFWIGAKYSNDEFHWMDKTNMTYSNWVAKGPRNISNYCVQMQADIDVLGQWIDEPCERKTLAVCQRMQTWSVARLQKTLLDTRKTLNDLHDQTLVLKHNLEEANKKLNEQKQNIDTLQHNQLPLGFIYTQLPNEKAPNEIFPSMNWTDVSATYAGVFFRVNGGGSATFGQVQEDNSPRLTEVKRWGSNVASEIKITPGTWSDDIYITTYNGGEQYCSLKFLVSAGEVRPKNMAIRIWKRSG